jgi:hypothetical protein
MIDLSKSVERLEAMEDKLGVRIAGIFVTVSAEPFPEGEYMEGEYKVEDFLERGKKLADNLKIKLVCYDAAGRVVGTGEELLWEESFHGYDAFTLEFYVKSLVSKARIFPTGA